MNKHLLVLQVRDDRRQIALDLQRRRGGLLKMHAELVGDDVGQRRLAQPRRPVEQHVVHRLAARFCGLDRDLQILFHFVLPDELPAAAADAASARTTNRPQPAQPIPSARGLASRLGSFFGGGH